MSHDRQEVCASRAAVIIFFHFAGRAQNTMSEFHTTHGPGDGGSGAAAGFIRLPDIEGYEVVRELSHGGQGVVYQAVQKSTKRKVALKVLLEGSFAARAVRKRFEREIEL